MLGRAEIEALLKDGLLEDHDPAGLESCGYDLRVGRVFRLESDSYIMEKDRKTPDVTEVQSDRYALAHGEYVLVETIEKVSMPGGLAARILSRSSVFRCGCSLQTALVDPGYRGKLTMGLLNCSDREFRFEKKTRIAQIVFEKVHGKTVLYDGKYQGGKIV